MSGNQKRWTRREFVKNTGAAIIGMGSGMCAVTQGALMKKTKINSGIEKKIVSRRKNNHLLVIDVHRHCMPQPASAVEGMMQEIFKYRISWNEHSDVTSVTVDGITSICYPDFMDLEAQIKGQDESGVTMSLLSGSMFLETICQKMMFMPDTELNKRLNDTIAGMVEAHPDKLAFMATVNPYSKNCINECERCFNELGAHGISIGTSWGGEYLDSPQLDDFWEYVQDKNEAIFLHPPQVPLGAEKMNVYKLEEMVGRPFDTTMTISRMIFSGVFDRYPHLKVVVPHMGAALPNVAGRLDFGYRLGYKGLPDSQRAICKRKPSDYYKTNLYVDTMGFSPQTIKHCIELFGVDRVLFGSDYAAVPIIQKEHVDIVQSLELSQDDEEKILWKNANALFKLI